MVVVRSGEQEVVEGAALVGIITAVVAEVTLGVGVALPDYQASPDKRLALVHMPAKTEDSRQL